jgi:3-hydroxyisobutyrate dehydrogenase
MTQSPSIATRNIAIIGVGYMGHGIARNILKAGFALKFLDHSGNQPTDDVIALGGQAETDVQALGQWADVVLLCVTGTPEVEDVLYQQGLLETLGADKTLIDCSTAIPTSTQRIAQDVQTRGARFIDAPMTRTPKEAEEGRLNLIVGADPVVFEAVLPLLQSFAENIAHAGDVSAGHQMKLIHNFVSLGFAAVLSEATAAAQIAGIKPEVLLDILGKGGGDGVVFNRLKPYIADSDASGFTFSMANAAKDMGYYEAMAADLHAGDAIAASVSDTYKRAVEQKPYAKVPELIDILRRQARQ